MFDGAKTLIDWLLTSATSVWNTVLTGMGFIGVVIIGLPIVRKVVELMRKIF